MGEGKQEIGGRTRTHRKLHCSRATQAGRRRGHNAKKKKGLHGQVAEGGGVLPVYTPRRRRRLPGVHAEEEKGYTPGQRKKEEGYTV